MEYPPLRRDPEYEFPSPGAAIEFEAASNCSFLSVLSGEDSAAVSISEERILDDTSLTTSGRIKYQ